MKAMKKPGNRGFTLVELMIVVAIIGVLAALAIYGVRRYLASSKTSEAKNTVGAIARGASAAYEHETRASQDLTEGNSSTAASHSLCDDSTDTSVPGTAVPEGKKYQPNTADTNDYETDSTTVGWRCLKFEMTQPHYYQYNYAANAMVGGSTQTALTGTFYQVSAFGDLDGDSGGTVGANTSEFSSTGQVNTTTKQLKRSTQLYLDDEFE